ncbi:MAG: ferric siderophore transporter ATP-binding protein [Microbacteriaceae bacterium]|jgi:iron(III) transport system substrate-binding protein|nr:ferric siderophore transporter ATP-binding protein [Microbacteriaceae bacterium]HEV7957742.1 iron ABC transporter substrate-binding protein [Marisediminicola sp.]
MRAPRFLTTAGITILALGLTSCAGASPAEDAAAESTGSDGELTLYAGRDEALIAPLIEKFTDDTGIEVIARYGSSSELNALLLEEGDNTPAQVFLSQDAGALGSLSNAGLVAKIPEQLAELIPAGFTSEDDSWIGITGRARVIAYDGEKLSEEEVPDAVDDLIAPEWNGRVGFAPGNASMQSFVTAYRVLEGEEAADAWVQGISENSPVLTESNGATLDLVNSGQLDIGLINHYYWFEDAAEVGADGMRAQLKFLPGDAGGMVNVTGAAILSSAAEDPDALEFLEYLVSEAGQRYFVENTFEYPLLPGVDAPEGLPKLESLVNADLDLSNLASLEQTQELLAKYGLL